MNNIFSECKYSVHEYIFTLSRLCQSETVKIENKNNTLLKLPFKNRTVFPALRWLRKYFPLANSASLHFSGADMFAGAAKWVGGGDEGGGGAGMDFRAVFMVRERWGSVEAAGAGMGDVWAERAGRGREGV